MPPNTIKVDRTSKWGNPFIVGKHGTQGQCVDLFAKMLAGDFCLTTDNIDLQRAYREMAIRDRAELTGKNLACWCAPKTPCHVDVLLRFAAHPHRDGRQT